MFKRLIQAVSRNLFEPSILQNELKNTLGAEYAAEVQALTENRLQDEALRKRATGVAILGRAIVQTRSQLKDPERHQFIWREIAKPGIEARFNASQSREYDPARFYVDALDYAATLKMLPTLLQGGEQTLAIRMVDTLQNLNIRFSDSAGYFGNTPYWTLNNNPLWRAVDRDFVSVQIYWMILLLVDQLTAEVTQDWKKAILTADLDEVSAYTSEQRTQLLEQDMPTVAYLLSLGSITKASIKNPESLRSQALMQIVSSIGGDPMGIWQAIVSANSMNSIRLLKSIFEFNHPIQVLPDSHFSLALMLQAGIMKPVLGIQVIQDLIVLPRNLDVLENPKESMPHLLQASL